MSEVANATETDTFSVQEAIENMSDADKKSLKRGSKSIRKSEEMVPRFRRRSWKQVGFWNGPGGVAPSKFLEHFGGTWAMLGAILGSAGRQGAPQIGSCGIKSH